jgi:2-phosphosulfolactate phosphatase
MPVDPVTPGDFEILCEWGLAGLRHLAPVCRVLVIIDVLSFSTSVEIAVNRGAVIYPYSYRDERLDAFALSMEAEVAERGHGSRFSLSPSSLLDVPRGKRLVLPSPNGSTLSREASASLVLTACLRNARAVAHHARGAGGRIGLVPAGERWGDGSLRPALEDWLGAGAIISHLEGRLSPEALAARAVFLQARTDLPAVLLACASGRELVEKGRPQDVHLAADLDCSRTVPVLESGAYHAWSISGT